MKTLPGSLLLLLLLLLLTNCGRKDGADDPGPTPDPTSFPDVLASGSWVVSAYTEKGEDKTADFKNLRFTFDKSGLATAAKGSSSTPGSWVWGGNGYYGTPENSKTVTFVFGTQKPLDRITGGWLILGASSTSIRLDSSNPAEQEHLELSR